MLKHAKTEAENRFQQFHEKEDQKVKNKKNANAK
jgi:hypothetical protein